MEQDQLQQLGLQIIHIDRLFLYILKAKPVCKHLGKHLYRGIGVIAWYCEFQVGCHVTFIPLISGWYTVHCMSFAISNPIASKPPVYTRIVIVLQHYDNPCVNWWSTS